MRAVAKKWIRDLVSSPRVTQFVTSKKLMVVLYHDVDESPSPFSEKYELNVKPSDFESQVRFLKNNFNVISAEDLLSENWVGPAVLITFDDGFKSVFKTALPTLEKYSCPATIFLNMGPVQGERNYSSLLTMLLDKDDEFHRYLDKKGVPKSQERFLSVRPQQVDQFLKTIRDTEHLFNQLKAYEPEYANLTDLKSVNSKFVSFGNHLFHHYNARTLSDVELKEAYLKNENHLNQFSNHVPLFAYPFGAPSTCYSTATDELIQSLGARRVFTTKVGLNKGFEFSLNRLSLFHWAREDRDVRYSIVKPTLRYRIQEMLIP